ncbi:hypothetical protein [Rhodospirillum sp. A1_3_36]|uniref:CHAT domain-containing tetratricopeptide repeat protein n=1 Tax=Rhodospirillum sp. A1_3_36 TaxID=3391666 RepID=UPI0039A60C91
MTGNDGLDDALTRLIGAQGLAAKHAVLVAEGEVLLAPRAEERLAALTPDPLDEIGLALHQSLLRAYREHGLDDGANAFVNKLINAWLADDDWGRKVTLLADWSDPLLSDEVSEGLAAFIQEETPLRERVQWHLDLLKSCRALGVSEGARQHGEVAGKTPPATPNQPDTPATLLEELSRLRETNLPESWPRQATIIETLLLALPPSGGEELDLLRAHLASDLATTYQQLLDAGMVDPTQAKPLLERAHALFDEALEIFRRLERWVEVATTATNKALLLTRAFEAGEAGAAPHAHALFDEALDIRRRHQRWVEVAQTAQSQALLLTSEFEAGEAGAAPHAHVLNDEALEIFRRHQRWVEVAQTASNKANLLQIEFNAGEAGAAPRAHALYDEALEIFRHHQRWVEVANTATNKAALLLRAFKAGEAGAAPRAHALFDEALDIRRRHHRWVEVAQTATNKASLLLSEFMAGEAGAAPRAHALFDEALDIRRRHQRWVEVANTAQNQALLLQREFEAGEAGAAPRAHALFDEALDIRRRHQRWVEVAQTATNKANLLQSEFEAGEAGAAQRAHALFDEALDIRRRHQRWVEVATTATNKATLLLREFEAGEAGAAPRAHALYDEALDIRRHHQRWVEVATTATNQANLLAIEFEAGEAGAAPCAHALYDEALEISRRLQRWVEVATTATNQANLLAIEFNAGEVGAAPRAHALYDEALEIRRRHQRWVEVAQTATNKATLLARAFEAGEVGAAPRAHALYDEALEIRRRHQRWVEVASTAQNQANLLQSEFKAGEAGAAQHAHALYDEAERLSPFDMGALQNLTIRRNHMNLLIRMEDWRAVVALVEAMQADVRRRLPTLGATADRHHLLAVLRKAASRGCMAALALGEVDQAVAILENGRSIDLGARLREAEAGLSPSQRADLDAARRDLYGARTAYQAAWSADPNLYPDGAFDAQVKAAKRELDARNAAFEILRSSLDLNLETPPPPPRDLLQALGPDSVVVQFWIGPRGGGALILGSKTDGWHQVPLPSLTEDGLDALLGDWFAAYQEFRQDMAPFAEAVARFSPAIMRGCQDLWSLAMGPLHAALAAQGLLPANGAQRAPEVVICPPGRFSILPLHAAINPATGQAFLDDYAVRYAPSLAAVLTATDRAAGRALFDRALVAVTNPQDDLGVEHNPALPFFAPSQRIDLRGYRHVPEATEVATADRLVAETRNRTPSCVSFYGHGGWDNSEAENSAIFLASPLDTAGKIPLDDVGRTKGVPFPTTAIRDLPLANCRLFILAGCETGMIDLNRAPDEFIGLPAAVLEGGAAGALASLWPVSTLDTYTLVQRTLEDIQRTDASPAQALRRAQLRLRDDPDVYVGVGQGMGPAAPGGPAQDDPTDRGRSPYTWAAFSLFGA